jgi:hypothetical protein
VRAGYGVPVALADDGVGAGEVGGAVVGAVGCGVTVWRGVGVRCGTGVVAGVGERCRCGTGRGDIRRVCDGAEVGGTFAGLSLAVLGAGGLTHR